MKSELVGKWIVYVRSDVVMVEVETEEGPEEREGYAFYVIAEAPSGVRYRHFASFPSAAGAERLVRRMVASRGWKGPRGSAHWFYSECVYGSPDYEAFGAAEEAALERKEAGL